MSDSFTMPPFRRRLALLLSALILLAALAAIAAIVAQRAHNDRTPAAVPSGARLVYLAPASAYARNLVLIDRLTGTRTPLTAVPDGVEDYAVSPSGAWIAFTHNHPDSTADLWLVSLADGAAHPITACVRARCSRPAWSPDESAIVYQRAEFGAPGAGGLGASRLWIVDLATLETHLLYSDPQTLGAGPIWSPDGARIAAYDVRAGGIRVLERATGAMTLIPIAQDVSGVFAPDSMRLVYPILVRGAIGQQFYTHLEIADLHGGTRSPLVTAQQEALDDGGIVWSPDGSAAILMRRYLDARYTPGRQLYRLDVATGVVSPLVLDAAYTHAAAAWDPTGQHVVYQRFDLQTSGAQPEVWIVDVGSGATQRVAEDALLPAWVP